MQWWGIWWYTIWNFEEGNQASWKDSWRNQRHLMVDWKISIRQIKRRCHGQEMVFWATRSNDCESHAMKAYSFIVAILLHTIPNYNIKTTVFVLRIDAKWYPYQQMVHCLSLCCVVCLSLRIDLSCRYESVLQLCCCCRASQCNINVS